MTILNEKKKNPLAENFQSVLERAGKLVDGDRRRDYRHPSVNLIDIAMRRTLRNFASGIYHVVTPYDVSWDMSDMKIARDAGTSKQDNQDDNVGYMTTLDRMQHRLIEMTLAKNIEEANAILRKADFVHLAWLTVEFNKFDNRKFALMKEIVDGDLDDTTM